MTVVEPTMVPMESGSIELGHGVRVVETRSGLVVTSDRLALGWTPRAGRVPGTAVGWSGRFWEVTERGGGSRVERWVLEPWRDGEAMRRVVPLDVDGLHLLASEQRREESGRRRSVAMSLASPILGFAPGEIQKRWENEHGYPAMLGVVLSSVIEIGVGAFAIVQLMALGFSGTAPGSLWLTGLMVPAPLLLVEGMARLYHANAHGEPMGSILGAPLLVLTRRGPGPERVASSAEKPEAARWLLGTTLLAAAVCFAPGEYQELWARRENVAPWIPTAAGAGLELFGGVVDLVRYAGMATVWSLISLALVAEGSFRLAGLFLSRRPVGSLLGIPLKPLYRRFYP